MFQRLHRLIVAAALCAAFIANAAPGDLDIAGFNAGLGKVITPIGASRDLAYAVVLQPDGKIVVAGSCDNNSNFDFCLARYQANGTLDSSFGTDGKVITQIGAGGDEARALTLQPDGKIVVAGGCANGGNYDFCLARYQSNGTLDTSFGGNGKVSASIGAGGNNAYAVALQPDGKILVAGGCANGGHYGFCLARFQTNGTLDTGFGADGKVITSIGAIDDEAYTVALQPDGKIVLAGFCLYNSNYDFCLIRYEANGMLDSGFGTSGIVSTSIGVSGDVAQGVSLQPDGKIVVAGSCDYGGNFDFCLARYHANGTLDTDFGTGGKVSTSIGVNNDLAFAVALQPDGKIVVAGNCFNVSNYDFCLARYQSNGTLDTSFGASGRVITPIGTASDYAFAVALQPDGKIVVAGSCFNGSKIDFCLARYAGGSFGYQNCKLDIDGDGRVLATTDMLIGTRIALGITGPAVVNGINFPPTATRTTWPLIRDYLVTQCGISLVQ